MSTLKTTAVVTGASSGLGSVYAHSLAARGFNLILIARREDRLSALADKLTSAYGTQVKILAGDLENEEDLKRVEGILSTDPSISLLVNNAGVAKLRTLANATLHDCTSQIALNITALTRLTHAVLPGLVARNSGGIINVASVMAVQSFAMSAVYSGSKAYVLAFTRGLQAELENTGVKVQVVLPASTATEFWDESTSGVPLSALKDDTVMTAQACVDAAMAGFDMGETITWPSLEDSELWIAVDNAQNLLFAATQSGTPATRYHLT